MSQTDVAALVQRLKGAGEGSRELDALLWLACNLTGEIDIKRTGRTEVPAWRCRLPGSVRNSWASPSPVTTSLDAALALAERLLPGWDFVIARANGGLTIHAQLGSTEHHFANTPALALCIAILRALPAAAPVAQPQGEVKQQSGKP